jgi:hypothetical protein
MNKSSKAKHRGPLHSRSISQLNSCHSTSRQHLSDEPVRPIDILPPDKYPPLAAFEIPKPTNTITVGKESSPYITASEAHHVERAAQKRREEIALGASKLSYNLKEVRHQKERHAEMEAHLISMSQAITDHDMGDHEEEMAAHCLTKKTTAATSSATSSLLYSSPKRVSKGSKKQNQVSSPATHYATDNCRPDTPVNKAESTLAFFEPGGEAGKIFDEVTEFAQCLASHRKTPSEVIKVVNNKDDGNNHNEIDGHPEDFMGDDSYTCLELGHDTTGQLSMAHTQPNILIASPPKHAPALCPSSFAPVINNPIPSMGGAVKVDPNFCEGIVDDGSGPGPHFITMSVVKDVWKIKEQLLSALTQTVAILTKNLPNCLIHGITKPNRIPPLPNATCSHFPSCSIQMPNYMYVPNAWSLTPGVRNKPRMPALKVGKNGRPVFDKNQGYKGPDQITAIMWITADCNVKDALLSIQMELKGEKLQLCWKPAQKKSRNQIIIYGLVRDLTPKAL